MRKVKILLLVSLFGVLTACIQDEMLNTEAESPQYYTVTSEDRNWKKIYEVSCDTGAMQRVYDFEPIQHTTPKDIAGGAMQRVYDFELFELDEKQHYYLFYEKTEDGSKQYRLQLELGGYYSLLIDGDFSGTAYDGYLRKGDPTGEKVLVSEAAYDFSDYLRNNHFGLEMGAEWRAFTHLNIYSDFTWGLNNIFEDDFKSISFAMYPIYLNVGFAYLF